MEVVSLLFKLVFLLSVILFSELSCEEGRGIFDSVRIYLISSGIDDLLNYGGFSNLGLFFLRLGFFLSDILGTSGFLKI